VKERRGRRSKQLLDDFKEKRRYCKLKEKALDLTLWTSPCERGYRSVVRQTIGCIRMNISRKLNKK
jgi:hypothetical protein